MIEAHGVFSGAPDSRSLLKRRLPKTVLEKRKLLPDEKSHGLGIYNARIIMQKKNGRLLFFFPTIVLVVLVG